MKILFRSDASEALLRKVAAFSSRDLDILCCPESEDAAYASPILTAVGAEVRYWSRTQRSIELETLVATSDVVSLHLPLAPETKGLFDARKMKPGAEETLERSLGAAME